MFYYFLPADTPENWEKASTETIAYLFLQDCFGACTQIQPNWL